MLGRGRRNGSWHQRIRSVLTVWTTARNGIDTFHTRASPLAEIVVPCLCTVTCYRVQTSQSVGFWGAPWAFLCAQLPFSSKASAQGDGFDLHMCRHFVLAFGTLAPQRHQKWNVAREDRFSVQFSGAIKFSTGICPSSKFRHELLGRQCAQARLRHPSETVILN